MSVLFRVCPFEGFACVPKADNMRGALTTKCVRTMYKTPERQID